MAIAARKTESQLRYAPRTRVYVQGAACPAAEPFGEAAPVHSHTAAKPAGPRVTRIAQATPGQSLCGCRQVAVYHHGRIVCGGVVDHPAGAVCYHQPRNTLWSTRSGIKICSLQPGDLIF